MMNDADRLRIHGRVQPMDDAPRPLFAGLCRDISSRPPAGPSPCEPVQRQALSPSKGEGSKGHTRITVVTFSLCAAAVILLILRSF
ncbi:MAG TPA: hypothetical protein VJQ77_05920 [Novosphingobium sp.]|nr:hypothetical protein [Novosphingobium sp.]